MRDDARHSLRGGWPDGHYRAERVSVDVSILGQLTPHDDHSLAGVSELGGIWSLPSISRSRVIVQLTHH